MMRIIESADQYTGDHLVLKKFASSAPIQKYTDQTGIKAVVKNVAFNALRWIATLTVVPMGVAALLKHRIRKQVPQVRTGTFPGTTFSLNIQDKAARYSTVEFHDMPKAHYFEKYKSAGGRECLLLNQAQLEADLKHEPLIQNTDNFQVVARSGDQKCYRAKLIGATEHKYLAHVYNRDGQIIKDPTTQMPKEFQFSPRVLFAVESTQAPLY